ncbi:hypothetical protein MMC25_005944 [Agyrium rufum]|nr:hypothetical protein [Agyrium rufum]
MFPKFSFRSKATATQQQLDTEPSIMINPAATTTLKTTSAENAVPRSPMPWDNMPLKRVTTSISPTTNTYNTYHQKSIERDPITGAPLFPQPDFELLSPIAPQHSQTMASLSPHTPSVHTFPSPGPLNRSPSPTSARDTYFSEDDYRGLRFRKGSTSPSKSPAYLAHDVSETATLVDGESEWPAQTQTNSHSSSELSNALSRVETPMSPAKRWLTAPGRKMSAVLSMDARRGSNIAECEAVEEVNWGEPTEWMEKK